MRPTHERVREALDYDPETGLFTWRERVAICVQVGSVAGSRDGSYWRIKLDGKSHRAHILAWFWVTGEWPTHHIDHIDGDTLNNRFANLRDEPRNVNMQNIVAPNRNNQAGVRGVRRRPSGNWETRLTAGGRTKFIGTYPTPEEASAAYWAAKAEHHGVETYQGRL